METWDFLSNFLLGVMRFLQTEWHRHERDRNAWEIEKQEMKGRIANLEGQARRADATQKALKKYVTILEKKVKEQAAELKSASGDSAMGTASVKAEKLDRAAMIQEKLRRKYCIHLSLGLGKLSGANSFLFTSIG
jgi:striatin 1/3/4